MTTKTTESLNIYQRMLNITAGLESVAKGLNVQVTKTSSYKAVSERDILDAVKPLEAINRVYSYPYKREIIVDKELTRTSQYGDSVSQFIRVETVYRFLNIDNPSEYVDITSYGDGVDTQDKAPGKAMTYADKYALMKAYKISTGDDPDKDASQVDEKVTTKASLATDKQIGMIKSLYNQEELTTMLERLNKPIEQLTVQEASKMIAARSKK